MKKKMGWLGLLLSICLGMQAQENIYRLEAPEGSLAVMFGKEPGVGVSYRLEVDGTSVIEPSLLALGRAGEESYSAADWKVETIHVAQVDTVWKPIWGKRSLVPDVYRTCGCCWLMAGNRHGNWK